MRPEDRVRGGVQQLRGGRFGRLAGDDAGQRADADQRGQKPSSKRRTNIYDGEMALEDLDDDRAASVVLVTDSVTNQRESLTRRRSTS
ncbi:MAG: hypothetical protein R2748_17240 [Bryobacterales bacterium]